MNDDFLKVMFTGQARIMFGDGVELVFPIRTDISFMRQMSDTEKQKMLYDALNSGSYETAKGVMKFLTKYIDKEQL